MEWKFREGLKEVRWLPVSEKAGSPAEGAASAKALG